MQRIKTLSWWYWLATAILLAFAVDGNEWARQAAIALSIVQLLQFGWIHRQLSAFPVQVRSAYLGLLLLSYLPGGIAILWLQLLGTTAMVTANYCLLARVLSLMPWNRDTPVTPATIIHTIFSAPVTGSVQQKLAKQPS